MHVDARDWIRGRRPWPQFLTYAIRVANTEGSDLWAAQLSDDRNLPAIKSALRALGDRPVRPPLAGHTAVVAGLYLVANQIRQLTGAIAHTVLPPLLGPEMPTDRITAAAVAQSLAQTDAAIG